MADYYPVRPRQDHARMCTYTVEDFRLHCLSVHGTHFLVEVQRSHVTGDYASSYQTGSPLRNEPWPTCHQHRHFLTTLKCSTSYSSEANLSRQ